MNNSVKNGLSRSSMILILVMVLFPGIICAQPKVPIFLPDDPFSLSIGFSSLVIMGNNPNNSQYIKTNNVAGHTYPEFGAFMNGIQPGYSLLFEAALDSERKFKIPVGIDYCMLRSARRYSTTDYVNKTYQDDYAENSYNILSLFTGLNWFFWKVPSANVKFYLGADIKANFIGKGKFDLSSEYSHRDTFNILYLDSVPPKQSLTKSAVVRYGGDFKIGLEAEVLHPWFIHVSFGLGVMNAVGRDDNHGNLFVTAEETGEPKKELVVTTFNFNFMIQYRFGR